jgi:hypothetical protein
VAGTAEAWLVGNALVQASALGAAPDTLAGLRALARRGCPTTVYNPNMAGGARGQEQAT